MPRVQRSDLEAAVAANVLDADGAERLWTFLDERRAQAGAGLTVANALLYGGGLLIVGALTYLLYETWANLGGLGLMLLAGGYALVFAVLGTLARQRSSSLALAQMLWTLAVCAVFVVVVGLQHWLGWRDGRVAPGWATLRDGPALPAAATLIAGFLVFGRHRLPLVILPTALAAWYLLTDVADIACPGTRCAVDPSLGVSIIVGLVLAGLGYGRDLARAFAEGFWLHLVAALALASGLLLTDWRGTADWAVFVVANVLLVAFAVFVSRPVYAAVGAFGIAYYLFRLADRVFLHSLLFPLSLTLVGLIIVGCGLVFYSRQAAITAWIDRQLPTAVRAWRPRRP